jgi:hypothetical protein
MMNNNEDNGHPCRSPRPLRKKYVVPPLIKIAQVGEVTQLIIYLFN